MLITFQLQVFAEEFGDQLVVVVHQSNPISQLSKKQIIDIYMGRFNTFPEGTPAQPFDFPSGDSAKQEFYLLLLGKSERKVSAYWSRLLFSGRATPPKSAESKSQILAEIQRNPQSIAYVSNEDVTPEMKIVFRF